MVTKNKNNKTIVVAKSTGSKDFLKKSGYKIVNDTAYHVDTPEVIINILEDARVNHKRLRIYLGDSISGKDWEECYDVSGYIGRSGGNIQVPLLVHNSRSLGGAAILSDCIVKIETSKGKELLYKHPNYHKPNIYTVDIILRIKNWSAENEQEAKKEILERLDETNYVLRVSEPIDFKFKDQKGVRIKN